MLRKKVYERRDIFYVRRKNFYVASRLSRSQRKRHHVFIGCRKENELMGRAVIGLHKWLAAKDTWCKRKREGAYFLKNKPEVRFYMGWAA